MSPDLRFHLSRFLINSCALSPAGGTETELDPIVRFLAYGSVLQVRLSALQPLRWLARSAH
jgi:hypothetical protein